MEIGPGIGTMTQYLAEAAREVAAVEIDKTLLPILDDTLKDWDNVTVINNDILKSRHPPACTGKKTQGRPIKVVANLPILHYYPRSSWDCLRIRFLLILLLLWYRKKLRTECR